MFLPPCVSMSSQLTLFFHSPIRVGISGSRDLVVPGEFEVGDLGEIKFMSLQGPVNKSRTRLFSKYGQHTFKPFVSHTSL